MNIKKLRLFWKKDSIFKSMWLFKFINQCMRHGRLEFVEKNIHDCFKLLKEVTILGLFYFFETLFIIKPLILLRWVRKGRNFYQIGRPVHEEMQLRFGSFFLALQSRLRWRRKLTKFSNKLYVEIIKIVHTKNSEIMDFRTDLYHIANTIWQCIGINDR